MSHEILNQGAEAIIERRGNEITKKRIAKSYRIKEIDDRIRKLRTRSEAKIFEKASKVIPVPKVFKVDEANKEIIMENIEGKRLSDFLDSFSLQKQKEICEMIGKNISKLHNENIIHGDLTPSNMILVENDNIKNPELKRGDINFPDNSKVYFIDFGLGFISAKIEDKAVDLHLLREALEAGFAKNHEALFDSVKKGYSRDYKDAKLVLERFKAVEKRGRYKQGS
jgi:Kae1-associated kinase Bud32